MSWWTYVERVSGDDNQKVIAARTTVDQATISRWKVTGQPGKAENVVKFARAYKRPVLEALIAAGYITEAEAKVKPSAAPSLDSLTDEELAEEILGRMRRGGGGNERGAAPMKQPGSRPVLSVAARDVGRVSDGQRTRDAVENVGEEADPDGPEFGA